LNKAVAAIRRVRSSGLARNTFFYSINFAAQIGVQLGYFILISSSLGPSGYGVFASVTAVALFVGVFIGWGSERVLIQRVTVDHAAFPRELGHTLILNGLTLIPFAAITAGIFTILDTHGLSWTGLSLILLADLLFRKLNAIALFSFMAFDRAGQQTVLDITSQLLRLAAAAFAFLLIPDLTLDVWAIFYVCGSIIAAAFSWFFVLRELGRPHWCLQRGSLWLGFLYSLEFASLNGVKDLDKPVVVQSLGPDAGGIYTAAFRIVDAASAPIRALLYATYTRYFREAASDSKKGIAFGVRMLPFAALFSAGVGVALLIGAPFVPLLIGEDYAPIVPLLRWLAVYPILTALMGIGADILRAIGRQGLRVLIMAASTVAIVPFCWLGARYGGMDGAVWSRVAVQLLLAAASWFAVRVTGPR
jgi:O-antigen/teichoic acid export membrane protein